MLIPSLLFFYLLAFLHQPVSRFFVFSFPDSIVLFLARSFFSVFMPKGPNFNPNPLKPIDSNQLLSIETIAPSSILFQIEA